MKRIIPILFVLAFSFVLVACSPTEQPSNSLSDAYLKAAQKMIDEGDYASAINTLEEGYALTKDPALQTLLNEAKELSTQPQDTTAMTESATAPAIETSTVPVDTSSATEAVQLKSNYPIQIDMDDMLSANLLGETFYSAYEGGTLSNWMFLYVHDSSEPAVIYDALWFDAQLGQMTYYGILQQQAEDAGWGNIWVELVNGDTSIQTSTEANPAGTNTPESFVGTWSEYTVNTEGYGLVITIKQYDDDSVLVQVNHTSDPSASRIVYFESIVPYDFFYEGKASFNFEDDGWGNTGTMLLQKHDSAITCTIQDIRYIGTGSGAMWGIAAGEYLLTQG